MDLEMTGLDHTRDRIVEIATIVTDDELRIIAEGPDLVVHVDDDQTFRYRDASGDQMPIHVDEDFAKNVGLPGIIAHGLCTMAMTSQASSRTSRSGRAVSMIARSKNGEASPTREEATMIAVTTASCHR